MASKQQGQQSGFSKGGGGDWREGQGNQDWRGSGGGGEKKPAGGGGGGGDDQTKCYNCQGFGHIGRNCPSPPRSAQSGKQPFPSPGPRPPTAGTGGPAARPQSTPGASAGQQAPAQPQQAGPRQAKPSEEITYDFPVEDVTTNTTAALDAVTRYAGELIRTERGLSSSDKLESGAITEEKKDRGLRTAFCSKGTPMPIATNYLRIHKKPDWIYVYDVEMTEYDEDRVDGQGQSYREPMELRDRHCKKTVFELAKKRPQCQSLRDQDDAWVTDCDTIWSVEPLFLDQIVVEDEEHEGEDEVSKEVANVVAQVEEEDLYGDGDGVETAAASQSIQTDADEPQEKKSPEAVATGEDGRGDGDEDEGEDDDDDGDRGILRIVLHDFDVHTYTGKDVHVARVVITGRPAPLDLTQTVAQLFRNQTQTPTEDDDPAIIVRGLNAFITEYTKALARPTNSNRTQKSANKFFWNNQGEPLDAYKNFAGNILGGHYPITKALKGFFASVRPSVDNLLLNINTACSPFFQPGITVQEYYNRFLSSLREHEYRNPNQMMDRNDRSFMAGVLRGTKVRIKFSTSHDNFASEEHRFRIIKSLGAVQATQAMPNGSTVYTYFTALPAEQAALEAVHGQQLSINVGSDPFRDPRNVMWYPASWLEIITPQPVHGQLRSKQTENMIAIGQRKPGVNARAITTDGLSMFGFNNAMGKRKLASYQFAVGEKLIKIPARVLNSPNVLYRDNAKPTTRDAAWNLTGPGDSTFKVTKGPSQQLSLMPMLDLAGMHTWRLDHFGMMMNQAFVRHGLTTRAGPVDMPARQVQGVGAWNADPLYETTLSTQLQAACTGSPSSAIVVLPAKTFDLYASLKRVADMRLGIKTNCVVAEKIANKDPKDRDNYNNNMQYCANVAMKCNLRNKGDNHRLDPREFALLRSATRCETIVLGADVAHPMNGSSSGCPSIASVVGSVDDNFINFPGSMRLQIGRREFIDKLWDMVKERLIDWALARGGRLPKKILFYRDGVSESQYDAIRTKEITQLERAYDLARLYLDGKLDQYRIEAEDDDEIDGSDKSKPTLGKDSDEASTTPTKIAVNSRVKGKEPVTDAAEAKGTATEGEGPLITDNQKALDSLRLTRKKFELTYVIVGKRHNTRFYPTEAAESFTVKSKVNGNVKPGLCVDQVITHPYSFDFYLQSHQPIAGTGRAAHYFVLTNQMNLTPDQLQSITHAFCYTYAKATRGVSYCAPAYYADRLCDRGRAYLRHWLMGRDTNNNDYKLNQPANRDATQHKGDVMRHIHNSDYWRPHRNGQQKYGLKRRNPWHQNMDDIMFYL